MSTTHENNAPLVPLTLGQLLDRYDHTFPLLSAQLGDEVGTRKVKVKAKAGAAAQQRVPSLNGWLNAEKLVEAANQVFERNNVKLEKMEITETPSSLQRPALRSAPQYHPWKSFGHANLRGGCRRLSLSRSDMGRGLHQQQGILIRFLRRQSFQMVMALLEK